MQIARIPDNDAARVAALRAYGLDEGIDERRFQDAVDLAADLFGVPIALISLVEDNRQWFKARVGLEACGTGRDVSFCSHAILEPGQPLVVSDATRDERFADNPLVTGSPNIRFYAGQPLVNPEGHALGTLCLIDTVPRGLDQALTRQLDRLGRMVMNMILVRSRQRGGDEDRAAA
ncbi:MAG: GAF domain-containing protein [Planctomycetota bacterium]